MDNNLNDYSSMYGAIIGAAGQVATGLVNNAISQSNAQDQRDWQYQMWAAQNRYNDPGNMAARMRSAGLNPYTMTGAEPAGSAGTGAMAQTFPIENPLVALKTIAEVENLNASTGRTESESEKVLKEISLLDLAYERGLIEKEDYEKRLREYWATYSDKSEFDLQREQTEEDIKNTSADTDIKESQKEVNESQKDLNVSQKELNEANTATVNALRDHLVEVQKATAASLKASASLAREQCKKTKEETEKLSDEDRKRTWNITIGEFFGLADISILAPELQAKAAEYYWDFQYYGKTYESTIEAFQMQVNRYVEKNGHIVSSYSYSHSAGSSFLGSSANLSESTTVTY